MTITALPKTCRELISDGTDAAGFGATLAGGTYSAGLLGDSVASAASSPGFAPTTCTLAFWRTVVAGDQDLDDNLCGVTIDTGSANVAFRLFSVSDGTIELQAAGSGLASVSLGSFATGLKHCAVVISGGNAQFYFNGAAVGSPQAFSSGSSGGALTEFSNGASGGATGKARQCIIDNRAMSSDDIAYVYNSGTILPYASMSTGGGAGAGYHARYRRLILSAADE